MSITIARPHKSLIYQTKLSALTIASSVLQRAAYLCSSNRKYSHLIKMIDMLLKWQDSVDAKLTLMRYAPCQDDIFIVTYPKSGTTWMGAILYQLITDGNLENIGHIGQRIPYFEEIANSRTEYTSELPRVFKSHAAYNRIPKGPGRYIYVVRDGRDVMISAYKAMPLAPYSGFSAFFEEFMQGRFASVSWFKHVADWWENRKHLNVLFVRYEDMKQDLEGSIQRVADFCDFAIPPEKMPRIVESCSFAFMKQHADKFTPQPPVAMPLDAGPGMFAPPLGMEFDSGLGTPVPLPGMEFDGGLGMMPSAPAQTLSNTPSAAPTARSSPPLMAWQAGGDSHAAFFRKGIVGEWQEHFTNEQFERYKKAYSKYLGYTGLYEL